ncbi:MAG TPA: CRISPR system precrRNA processing endoribonuclease RAMP protein Cas6 [Acidobacteriota bacterium]|nr:CRISPR system precrRNA processing endoribonuclease RAMP protein Cas6 [Acidobacteriota bacterium]
MRKYTAAPHPFLLEVPLTGEGEEHEIGLTLIGRGARYLPYLIHALQRAGQRGLGKARVVMNLIEVEQAHPPEGNRWVSIYRPDEALQAYPPSVPKVPVAPPSLRIRFQTPLRLKRQGRLVAPKAFQLSDLFGSLLRRISMLTYFHTNQPLETDFAGLMKEARRAEATVARLGWQDWTRYSSRQRTTMQMGGLVGELLLELDENSPFWPYLWIGQWVHAGKGTSMGLGQYTLEAASLPDSKVAGL